MMNFIILKKEYKISRMICTFTKIILKILFSAILFSAIIENFSGFVILRKINEDKSKRQFRPINVVYHPVKHKDKIIVTLQNPYTKHVGQLLILITKKEIWNILTRTNVTHVYKFFEKKKMQRSYEGLR